MLRGLLFIFLSAAIHPSEAQTVKGSWYGRADALIDGNASNYLTELVLKQKGTDLEGIFGYYFKDSYQSFFIRGTFDPGSRQVNIDNLPLLFYGSNTRNGIECPMRFQGTLMVSKVKSTLTGMFYPDAKYKYTCPRCTVNMTLDQEEQNQDSALKNAVAGQRFWSPQHEEMVAAAERSAIAGGTATASTEHSALEDEFARRSVIYEKDIVVYDDSILVSFYDNGDIDDDTISVFLNKKPILIRRGLSSRALNIYIGLDSAFTVNELSMFADNLGKFPPNTALMVISDRQQRYEFYLSASLKQNASVRLRRPSKR